MFADSHSFLFIDQNELILSFFETHQRYQYTPNGVHPNSTKGIDLYSWTVMEADKKADEPKSNIEVD